MPEWALAVCRCCAPRIALGALSHRLIVFFGGTVPDNTANPSAWPTHIIRDGSVSPVRRIVPVSDTARLITTIFGTPLRLISSSRSSQHGGAAHRIVRQSFGSALESRVRKNVIVSGRNEGAGAVRRCSETVRALRHVVVDTTVPVDAASALGW